MRCVEIIDMTAHVPAFDPLVEEVRVAMALNGGVSLAIWMGGCAVELDSARRAHLGNEVVATANEEAPERRVYNMLTRAFQREFVVDIMSGASAGGINGALLAGAMRRGRRIHPTFLRQRWLEIGDFENVLLQPTTESAPTSLMRGMRFSEAMDEAFTALLEGPADPATDTDLCAPPPGQDVRPFDPVLDITMTNVAGEPRSFRDEWGEELVAREYRARFQFRDDADFNARTLAVAARSTASFPVAFEPNLVEGDAARLAKLGGPRWVIDGGLLNNAPVRVALAQIPTRTTRRRVRRFVCYLNADPPPLTAVETPAIGPPLVTVLGYVVNLPRNAPFADELMAAEQAVRASQFSQTAQDALLNADRTCLVAVADDLLIAYRDRRRLLSLEDLTGDPARARTLYECLSANLPRYELPWIPVSMTPPASADEWRWGIRTAQRAIQLQLDALREGLDEASLTDTRRDNLLAAWVTANEELDTLEAHYTTFVAQDAVRAIVLALDRDDDPTAELSALSELLAEVRAPVFSALHKTIMATFGVVGDLPPVVASRLFRDERNDPDSAFRTFLEAALAIEVVRRAFADSEDFQTAQQLAFVQLTPVVPILIWTSTPFSGASGNYLPQSPRQKLTGIAMGHFGAFYRGSWRVNDFLWGRLDAATRIVDMLVDSERSRQLGKRTPWGTLATDLLGVPGDLAEGQQLLVHEALADARSTDKLDPAVRATLENYPDEQPELNALRGSLEHALEADLRAEGPSRGRLTRVVMSRAVQLEILRHELPVLVKATESDAKIGCFTPALPLKLQGDAAMLSSLRALEPLPSLLGRDSGEEGVSNLALRTISHALFVALAVLKNANIPLAKTLAIVRTPLLPISGITSMKPTHRGIVGVGFAAAALYVAARLATAEKARAIALGDIWSTPVLLYLIALLGMAGVVAVPVLRGLRAAAKPEASARRRKQWAWAAALALSGGIVAIGLGWFGRHLGFAGALVTPDAERPPSWLAKVAVPLLLGVPVALRLARAVPFAERILTGALKKVGAVWLICAAAVAVGGWALWALLDVVVDVPLLHDRITSSPSGWQWAIAAVGASAPFIGGAYVLFGKQR